MDQEFVIQEMCAAKQWQEEQSSLSYMSYETSIYNWGQCYQRISYHLKMWPPICINSKLFCLWNTEEMALQFLIPYICPRIASHINPYIPAFCSLWSLANALKWDFNQYIPQISYGPRKHSWSGIFPIPPSLWRAKRERDCPFASGVNVAPCMEEKEFYFFPFPLPTPIALAPRTNFSELENGGGDPRILEPRATGFNPEILRYFMLIKVLVSKVYLFCFQFTPLTGHYSSKFRFTCHGIQMYCAR